MYGSSATNVAVVKAGGSWMEMAPNASEWMAMTNTFNFFFA